MIRDFEFYYDEPYVSSDAARALRDRGIVKFDMLLTTYETVIKDVRLLSKITWKVSSRLVSKALAVHRH